MDALAGFEEVKEHGKRTYHLFKRGDKCRKTSIVEAIQERDDVFFLLLPMICFRRWLETGTCEKIIGNISAR